MGRHAEPVPLTKFDYLLMGLLLSICLTLLALAGVVVHWLLTGGIDVLIGLVG